MDASSGAIDSKSSPKDQLAYFYRVFRDPDNAEYLLQPSATRQQRREDAPLTSVNIDQDDAAPSSRFRALQDRPNQVNQPNIFLAAKFLTEVLPGKIEEGFRTRSIFPMSRDGKGFLELATALSETEPSSLRGVTGLALHACYARLVMEYSNLQKLLETLFEEEGERVTFVQSRLADMAEKLHDIHIDYQERKNRLQGKPTDSSSSGGIGLGGRGGRDGRDGRDVDVDTVHWRTPPPLLSSSAHPSDHSARPHHAPRQLRHQAQYNHHHYRHYQPQRYKDEDSDQEMTSVRHSRDRVMRTSTIPPPLRPAPGPEARSSSSSSSTPAILPKPETTPSVSAHPRPYSTGATTTTGLSFTSSSEAPVSITTIPRQTPTPPHDNGIEPLSSTAMTTIAIVPTVATASGGGAFGSSTSASGHGRPTSSPEAANDSPTRRMISSQTDLDHRMGSVEPLNSTATSTDPEPERRKRRHSQVEEPGSLPPPPSSMHHQLHPHTHPYHREQSHPPHRSNHVRDQSNHVDGLDSAMGSSTAVASTRAESWLESDLMDADLETVVPASGTTAATTPTTGTEKVSSLRAMMMHQLSRIESRLALLEDRADEVPQHFNAMADSVNHMSKKVRHVEGSCRDLHLSRSNMAHQITLLQSRVAFLEKEVEFLRGCRQTEEQPVQRMENRPVRAAHRTREQSTSIRGLFD